MAVRPVRRPHACRVRACGAQGPRDSRARPGPLVRAILLVGATLASGVVLAAPPPGERLYMTQACALCHAGDAQGVVGMYPPLPATVRRFAQSAEGRRYLVAVITYGTVGTLAVDGHAYTGYMPEHPPGFLSDADLALLINWLATIGAPAHAPRAPFTAEQVHTDRATPMTHAEVLRLRGEALRGLPPK